MNAQILSVEKKEFVVVHPVFSGIARVIAAFGLVLIAYAAIVRGGDIWLPVIGVSIALLYILFTKSKMEIDYENKKAKESILVFGLWPMVKLIDLNKYTCLTYLRAFGQRERITFWSYGYTLFRTEEEVYKIVLMTDNHLRHYELERTNNEGLAMEKCNYWSYNFQVPFVKFNPQGPSQNRGRRSASMKKWSLVFLFFSSGFVQAQQVTIRDLPFTGGSGGFQPGGERLLYEKPSAKKPGYYEIHTVNKDGSADSCISCIAEVPQRHNGCATWHPSGDYILFLAEKEIHPRGSVDALPGFGAFTDIYLMRADGKKAWKLTDIPNDYDHGIIAPRLSSDGKKMVWVERKKRPQPLRGSFFGLWVIKVGDLHWENGTPQLKNIKIFEPGGDAFYETYGFSPDGKRILFCSTMHQKKWYYAQIFTIDAESGKDVRQLTDQDYNEHALYSPDGKYIIWMTNHFGTRGCDWWIMRSDGTGKQPLTYFNVKSNPQYMGKQVWAGAGFFNADGNSFFGSVQLRLNSPEGKMKMLQWNQLDHSDQLMLEYFAGKSIQSKADTAMLIPSVFFRSHSGTPNSLVKHNDFCLRIRGLINPAYIEKYTFYLDCDAKAEVLLDDVPLQFSKSSKNKFGEMERDFDVTQKKSYRFELRYFHSGKGPCTLKLSWSSPSQYKQLIPSTSFGFRP
ncbi:MAG: hypothetical protein K1X56_04690 [Flavobacteriales bacterium]|nr:hypothetical protein [Flavobacteriales bacterium]